MCTFLYTSWSCALWCCVCSISDWLKLVYIGRTEWATDVRLSKNWSLSVSYKCMFLSNYVGIYLPLVCRLFLSNTSKYIICWHARYLCQHAAQLCWYTWNFILNNDVPWFKCISQCFPYHLSSGTENVTHRRNYRRTNSRTDGKTQIYIPNHHGTKFISIMMVF